MKLRKGWSLINLIPHRGEGGGGGPNWSEILLHNKWTIPYQSHLRLYTKLQPWFNKLTGQGCKTPLRSPTDSCIISHTYPSLGVKNIKTYTYKGYYNKLMHRSCNEPIKMWPIWPITRVQAFLTHPKKSHITNLRRPYIFKRRPRGDLKRRLSVDWEVLKDTSIYLNTTIYNRIYFNIPEYTSIYLNIPV